ncbi:MAG: sulfur carrier protein ThiS [Fibrobacterota bacterium]
MDATINGKKRSFGDKTTLADLLAQTGVKPGQVVVEQNGQIIDRARLAEARISLNDTIEIVHFVGGG